MRQVVHTRWCLPVDRKVDGIRQSAARWHVRPRVLQLRHRHARRAQRAAPSGVARLHPHPPRPVAETFPDLLDDGDRVYVWGQTARSPRYYGEQPPYFNCLDPDYDDHHELDDDHDHHDDHDGANDDGRADHGADDDRRRSGDDAAPEPSPPTIGRRRPHRPSHRRTAVLPRPTAVTSDAGTCEPMRCDVRLRRVRVVPREHRRVRSRVADPPPVRAHRDRRRRRHRPDSQCPAVGRRRRRSSSSIHGGAQNAHTWDTVALALGRPLLAVDLPGHGHSGWRDDGAYTPIEPGRRRRRRRSPRTLPSGRDRRDVARRHDLDGAGDRHPGLVRSLVMVDVTPGVNADKAKAMIDFVDGPQSVRRFDDLLARTMEFNPTRSESSLRRGILHNAAPARRRFVAVALRPWQP